MRLVGSSWVGGWVAGRLGVWVGGWLAGVTLLALGLLVYAASVRKKQQRQRQRQRCKRSSPPISANERSSPPTNITTVLFVSTMPAWTLVYIRHPKFAAPCSAAICLLAITTSEASCKASELPSALFWLDRHISSSPPCRSPLCSSGRPCTRS